MSWFWIGFPNICCFRIILLEYHFGGKMDVSFFSWSYSHSLVALKIGVNSWFSSWIPEHKSQERRKLSTELLAIIINVLPWANIAVAHLWLRMSDSPYHHTSVRTNRVCQKNNFCLKKQEPLVTSSHVKFQISNASLNICKNNGFFLNFML